MMELLTRKKIFVAEDHEPQVELMRRTLGACRNYDIHFFSDGLELYNRVQDDKPDLLIVESILPSLSGLALARLLRFNEPFCDIPIVVIAPAVDTAMGERARDAGADCFVPKPFDGDVLRSEVERLLAY